jgi:hypothetical protein
MDCAEQVAQLQAQIHDLTTQVAGLNDYIAALNATHQDEVGLLNAALAQFQSQSDATLSLGNISIITTTSDNGGGEARFIMPDGSEISRPLSQSGQLTMRLALGLGIISNRAAEGGGDGTLLNADFINGVYTYNGAPVASADAIFDDPFGDVVIDGSGMVGGPQVMVDPYNSVWRGGGGFTVLIDFIDDQANIADIADTDTATGIYVFSDAGELGMEYFDGENSVFIPSNPALLASPQSNRLAITQRSGFIDVSLNGAEVITFAANTVAHPAAFLGQLSAQHYGAIKVWDARPSADLPGLSAP